MSPELADLVKAYLPPWWHNEIITKEEAQFEYTNHDVRIIEAYDSDWRSGWIDSPLFYDDTLAQYYDDLEHIEPRLNYMDESMW